MMPLTIDHARSLMSGRFGHADAPCPACGPQRRSATNQKRRTMRLWCASLSFITYHCARCGEHGFVSGSDTSTAKRMSSEEVEKIRADIAKRDAARRLIALGLWRRRKPIANSPVEFYLRNARCYRDRFPATIGFLPASGDFSPAMIAAIGIAHETAPGDIGIADQDLRGVHITSLVEDGSTKAGSGRDKIMIGHSIGSPIVLAPPNDLLGLAITEGIENGLSVHEATGLGVWAAGCASRMPALVEAVPAYINCITIVADGDDTGCDNAQKLADALANRDCEVRIVVPSANRRAS
jgi:hypothetical protein